MVDETGSKQTNNGGNSSSRSIVRQPNEMILISKDELLDILKNLEGVKRKIQRKLNIQA